MQRTLIASLCFGAIMAVKIDSEQVLTQVAAANRLHMEDVECAWNDDEHRWNWMMNGQHYFEEHGKTYVIDDTDLDYLEWGAHTGGEAVTEVHLDDEYIFGPKGYDMLPHHWLQSPSTGPYYFVRGSDYDYYFNADGAAVYQDDAGVEHLVDMDAPDAYLHDWPKPWEREDTIEPDCYWTDNDGNWHYVLNNLHYKHEFEDGHEYEMHVFDYGGYNHRDFVPRAEVFVDGPWNPDWRWPGDDDDEEDCSCVDRQYWLDGQEYWDMCEVRTYMVNSVGDLLLVGGEAECTSTHTETTTTTTIGEWEVVEDSTE